MDNSKYHLNTVYMKPSQQLTQGPYQSLRNQLSKQNFFNPSYVQKPNQNNMEDAMNELKKIMAGEESVDHSKLAHIHSIKLHPVINENFISSFDENQYKLQPQDKVKIVKEKVFRVQNYYNYLYELKCKQEHQKLQSKAEEILREAKKEVQKSSPKSKTNQQNFFHYQADTIVNDTKINEKDHFLAPQYSKYQERKVAHQNYFLKQKERKKVQESIYKRF